MESVLINLPEEAKLLVNPPEEAILIKKEDKNIIIEKVSYETTEQYVNKIIFFICCLDIGYSLDESETLCNVYRNKFKYNVIYPQKVEDKVNNILQKYNINSASGGLNNINSASGGLNNIN